jgi:DNA-directed RNA polymerase specialized sigma subunit
MQKHYNLSRDEIENLIEQWVLDDKGVEVMKLRLLRNHTYEMIAEEVNMSPRHIPRIIDRNIGILKKHGLAEMS